MMCLSVGVDVAGGVRDEATEEALVLEAELAVLARYIPDRMRHCNVKETNKTMNLYAPCCSRLARKLSPYKLYRFYTANHAYNRWKWTSFSRQCT